MNKGVRVAEVSQAYLVEAAEQVVPVGYKQTEVGVIPEDWEQIHLGMLVAALDAGVSVNSVDEVDAFSHGKHILKTSCVERGRFGVVKRFVTNQLSCFFHFNNS